MTTNHRRPCTSCGKTCTGGTTGLCLTCLRSIPARERTGTFGAFELRASHLQTQSIAHEYDSMTPDVPLVVMRQAATTAAAHVPREHLTEVLALLGILDPLKAGAA